MSLTLYASTVTMIQFLPMGGVNVQTLLRVEPHRSDAAARVKIVSFGRDMFPNHKLVESLVWPIMPLMNESEEDQL